MMITEPEISLVLMCGNPNYHGSVNSTKKACNFQIDFYRTEFRSQDGLNLSYPLTEFSNEFFPKKRMNNRRFCTPTKQENLVVFNPARSESPTD
jgi:hypothetical protein